MDMNTTKKTKGFKSGEWNGRAALYLHEGGGTGRMNPTPPVNSAVQMMSIVDSEELNCACQIITVPPLTWFKYDNSYIVTQFGKSEMKFLKGRDDV